MRYTIGDDEPTVGSRLTDAGGVEWRRADDGWLSSVGSYFDKPVTWWWLVMHRGPLTGYAQKS